MTEVTTHMVIRATYDLSRVGWPTADEVAAHLKVEVSDVRVCLRELKAKRLFKDRRRDGRQVWGPWSDEEFARR